MDVTGARINRLSSICSDIAQVCLGSAVIPFLVDKFNLTIVIWAGLTSLVFWILSLLLVRTK